ncbi:MAG: hypothetical protein JKY54_00805, partial [Flavobacteriales bacterium]|nr:hypothetical protein [Flavobacteriales bacterium]
MKKNINFLLITILTSLFFGISSCKKYEDGGNSFRRKQKIKDVTWNLNYRINANEYESKWETLSFENNGDFLINKILIGKYNFSNKNFIEININTDIDSINIHLIDNIQHIII